MANTSALTYTRQSKEIASYITGFVDGEGSFLVSFSVRPKLKIGIEARPSFTVSQHERSKAILEQLQLFFDCGSIRFDVHDRTYKYEVRSLAELISKIIPHFNKYTLQTSKRIDFELFSKICGFMKNNEHRSNQGIRKIIDVAYQLNNLGARRYKKEDLLTIVSKMKV
jgi:hypothetical protein